jgi:hypothetical protein
MGCQGKLFVILFLPRQVRIRAGFPQICLVFLSPLVSNIGIVWTLVLGSSLVALASNQPQHLNLRFAPHRQRGRDLCFVIRSPLILSFVLAWLVLYPWLADLLALRLSTCYVYLLTTIQGCAVDSPSWLMECGYGPAANRCFSYLLTHCGCLRPDSQP